MAQIRQVVSESLQSTIRRLLPSQQGFTEDLQATNVITPIIDLTPTAEGSLLPTNLQQSLAFGSQTAFNIAGATTVIANNAGFFRIFGTSLIRPNGGAAVHNRFSMSDGLSTKVVWGHESNADSATDGTGTVTYDFTVFLAAGESISGVSSDSACIMAGSVRTVADVNGNLTNPSGFVIQ